MNIPEQYADDVRSGRIVVCEYVKDAVSRYYDDLDKSLDKGFYLDKEAGLKAIRYIERLKHTKGKWAGQPLNLEPWQQFIFYNAFGWKRADGSRRFRYIYIEVARKNGKTAMAAGDALYMLMADKEPRAEVYSVATVRDQAKICFLDAVAIVESTALKSRISVYKNSMTYDVRGSFMKPLSSDDGIHDGYSPHCVIVDEYHAHASSGMFDVMKSGMGARRQPHMFVITTAGFNKNGPCYLYRKNAINVIKGIVTDESLFAMIFTLDKEDAYDDPAVWIKANPNLGVSVDESYIRNQVDDAKNRPEAVRNVRTKNLNCWVDAADTWMLDSKWMECVGDTDPKSLEGCDCWGGLDLSQVSDMTAYVLRFNENDKCQYLAFFWIPEETLQKKIEESNADFYRWVQEGYIKVTPGNVTDYDYIKADIMALHEKYHVISSAYDRWNSSQTIIDLQKEDIEMSPFGQGYASMSFPSKEFEKQVLTRRMEHFGNPVLRWMISSVAISTDPAGNIKPDKRKSSQKIDGVVAAIMANGEYLTWFAKDEEENPYAERGFVQI